MGINYVSLQSKAKRLVGPNGTKCILINPSNNPPVYNPTANEYEKQNEKFNGFCIVSSYEDKLVDGTVIMAGDRKIISVLEGEPKPGLSSLDVYDKKGTLKDSYKVVNSTKISPDASTIILYRLHCRK
jgi:hypothetical protein